MSEDDHSVARALAAELEAGGELVDAGQFSIDAEQARTKLREFQLADPYEYVLLLVEAAVLAGADPVRIGTDLGELTVSLGPLRISRDELEQLFAAAFVDLTGVDGAERSRRRALQKLAFACNAALRLNPEVLEVEVVGDESVLCLRLTAHERGELESRPTASGRTLADHRKSPRAASLGPSAVGGVAETRSTPGTTSFRLLAHDENPGAIRHDDFSDGLLGVSVRVDHGKLAPELREVALVRERCRFSQTRIEIDGELVSAGHRFALHVELDPERPALSPNARKVQTIELDGRPIGCAGFRYTDDAFAEVWILTNGVLAEHFVLGDDQRVAAKNFGAIVELDLPKDLGQAKLARGPEYERVIEAIWAVHDQLAPSPSAGLRPSTSAGVLTRVRPFTTTGLCLAGMLVGLVLLVSGFILFGVTLLFGGFMLMWLQESR